MHLPSPRYLAIALIAWTPILVLIALCQSVEWPVGPELSDAADAGFAALPARGDEAPLLSLTSPSQSDMDAARAKNAAIPFYSGKIAPAPAFRFAGSPTDFERARECLALAAMAEAGPTDEGQRAVIQVILNRVRHPAFAKTVCGVVFEGSQRATGCQFSFTCDGSLARRYGEEAWNAARMRAETMLRGQVYAPVGNATHYHTDWVFPYWSPKLVKLAQVETHLFFRWPGYWGSAAAGRVAYHGGEPEIRQLLAPPGAELPTTLAPVALPSDTPKVTGGQVAMRVPSGKGNFLLLASPDPAQALANARKLCGTGGTCRVLGWSEAAAIPASFAMPPASRTALRFSYSRDPAGAEIVLYDCHHFAGISAESCIPKAR